MKTLGTTSTDTQQRLRRAWSSSYYRKPVNYLRLLLEVLEEIGTERKVYRQQAEKALASGSIRQLEDATATVRGEITRRQQAVAQARQVAPRLYRAAA